MSKNYYAILGILPTATPEDIRSAYLRRVKQYHPDHFGRDSAPFLNVQEAYDVLSDPADRASYDRKCGKVAISHIRKSRPQPEMIRPRKLRGEPLRRNRGPIIRESIYPLDSFRSFQPSFDEILDNLRNAFYRGAHRKGDRFQTLTMEVVLTPDQANRGGSIQILLPLEAWCPTCEGSGNTGIWECWDCNGSGAVLQNIPLEVNFPPGMRDGYQVAIPLDRFGLHDLCQILFFRISPEGDFQNL
jgi:molecular chaperone DnaJ